MAASPFGRDKPRGTAYAKAMRRAIGATLGALAGLAFSTMGLIDTAGEVPIASGGGNEATPLVIAVGVAIGALLGLTVLWRFPLAILGAIMGLVAGMWLRDNATLGSVQPPWVFFLLFGLPAVGIVGGYLLHLPRTTWARHSVAGGVLAGLVAATASYAAGSALWASATHDPRCDPVPLPDGGTRVLLCPDTGTPSWIALVAVLTGAAVGIFTRAKLDSNDGPASVPRTS